VALYRLRPIGVRVCCGSTLAAAVKHKKYPKIQGVQFHPESIITENGLTIIRNWVNLINA
jgi:anthranilate/para-aminobenzoate synthase component II